MRKSSICGAVLVAVASVCCGGANAAPLQWFLRGAAFNDLGSGGLSGSYFYDTTLDDLSDVNILATGTAGGDGLYVTALLSSSRGVDASQGPLYDDLEIGDRFLTLFLSGHMTDAGGTILINEITIEEIVNVIKNADGSVDEIETTTTNIGSTGNVTTIPEPASAALLALGGAALGRRRRRANR